MRRGTEYFSRVVDHLADLPHEIRAAFESDRSVEPIRQIISIPPQRYHVPGESAWWRALTFGHRTTPHRTLLFQADQITLIEGLFEPKLQVIVIPAQALVAFKVITVLLYSYIELAWIAANQIETTRIEFNSVGLELIKREIDQIRSHVTLPDESSEPFPYPPMSGNVVPLSHLPLKFRNFARASLLPGEQLRAAVYEPMIRRAGIRLNPYISPNRAIVLTDQNVIIIEDAESNTAHSLAASYQIGRYFCPRRWIHDVTVDEQLDVAWVQVQLGNAHAQHSVRLPLLGPRVDKLKTALVDWPHS